jgi:hypothetical protein
MGVVLILEENTQADNSRTKLMCGRNRRESRSGRYWDTAGTAKEKE